MDKLHIIENNELRITISEKGAELQSIIRKSDSRELLWQTDSTYWNRHSPILFPLVGHAYKDEFRIEGKTYPMGQHGFARDMNFDARVIDNTEIMFTLHSDETTRSRYPFDFLLVITYQLKGKQLCINWQVVNESAQAMPFHIGAHPGFNLPSYNEEDEIHGYLSFDVKDKLVSAGLKPGGYVDTETSFDVLLQDGFLPLTNTTFQCDTILDKRNIVRQCALHDHERNTILTLDFDMPVLALWSPCSGKAPFVCIEPWYGCCDPYGFDGEFYERPFTTILAPKEEFKTNYTITIE